MTIIKKKRDFPGDPVVRTLPLHCKGQRFNLSCGQNKSRPTDIENKLVVTSGEGPYKGPGVEGTHS